MQGGLRLRLLSALLQQDREVEVGGGGDPAFLVRGGDLQGPFRVAGPLCGSGRHADTECLADVVGFKGPAPGRL